MIARLKTRLEPFLSWAVSRKAPLPALFLNVLPRERMGVPQQQGRSALENTSGDRADLKDT